MEPSEYKLIIADDEIKIVQLIKHLINWDKLPLKLVGTANNGLEALNLIKKESPHIVILDIRMPGFNGIELISKTKEFNSDIHFIIVSGYRHFDYAHKAIKFGVEDYLLKPVKQDEINKTLKNIIEKKQKNNQVREITRGQKEHDFLIEMFQRGNRNALTLDDCRSKYNLNFTHENLDLILIKYDLDSYEINENETALLIGKAETVLNDNLGDSRINFSFFHREYSTYLLLNYNERDEKSIRNILINIIEGLHSFRDLFRNLKTTISRSGCFKDLIHIQEKIDFVTRNIMNRYFQGSGKILENKRDWERNNIKDLLTITRKNEILKCIGVLDKDRVERIIIELFDEMSSKQDVSGYFAQELLNELLNIFYYQFENQFGFSQIQKNRLESLRKLFQMQSTLHSQIAIAVETVKTTMSEYEDDRKNRDEKPILDAKKYIQEKFYMPLSLEEVSESIGMSPSYLSTIFKKKTGVGFVEYLTSIRIEEAKELLSNPQRSVSETAEEVGYKDTKHFTKKFKKIVGLSPAEYRKIYY